MGLSISTEMLPVVSDLLKLGLAIQPNKRTLSISQIISTLNDLKVYFFFLGLVPPLFYAQWFFFLSGTSLSAP